MCFTDPKRSKVDIVQAAGRALRLSKGKKFGYILIPIFIPAGADFNEAAEEQGFNDVAITVRALATTDTRIVEYLRAISEGKKPSGGSPINEITSANSLFKIEAEEFDKAIKLNVWDKVARSNFRPYEEAKKFALSLNLKSSSEWKKLNKTFPRDIPVAPHIYYNDFESWGVFLGTGNIAPQYRKFVSYEEAQNFAISIKVKSHIEWIRYFKKNKPPENIPLAPNDYYKNLWKGWSFFLDKNYKEIKYHSYEQSKLELKKFKLKSRADFKKLLKKNKVLAKKIPLTPNDYYKNKWEGWGPFIGTGFLRENFLEYKEAIKFVHKLKIKNWNDWTKYCKSGKKPSRIPAAPNYAYKDNGWKNIEDWLGVVPLINFEEAKNFVKKRILKLKQSLEFSIEVEKDQIIFQVHLLEHIKINGKVGQIF